MAGVVRGASGSGFLAVDVARNGQEVVVLFCLAAAFVKRGEKRLGFEIFV